MQCVLISWSECLWKVTWKPPFHFSSQQFFQQASALRSNPLQSVPFDIQSWLLRGLNFLIHWVFVSSSSTHHTQSPQLGADRLSPLGCCGSVRVYSFTFFTLLGGQFYTFMSSISFREINLHVTSVQDNTSLMVGSLKSDKASPGKENCLSRDLKPWELVASACPGKDLGLGGFLISFLRVREMTVLSLEQRKKSKCKAECLVCW